MTGARGKGDALRHPPQPPADIPGHLRHGSSYVHRHYKCRCGDCQSWRRSYDQAREWGHKSRSAPSGGGWYVCLGKWGATHAEHEYNRLGTCLRCGANRATEEHWEREWEKS